MVGEKLRRLYQVHQTTRNELSKSIHIHPRTVALWEKDEADPNLENLCSIADFFGTSLDELLNL